MDIVTATEKENRRGRLLPQVGDKAGLDVGLLPREKTWPHTSTKKMGALGQLKLRATSAHFLPSHSCNGTDLLRDLKARTRQAPSPLSPPLCPPSPPMARNSPGFGE